MSQSASQAEEAEPPSDIFISYARVDNEPLPLSENQKGWISEFHRFLEIRLTQLLGDKASIWRDERVQGNDYFSEVIVRKVLNVRLLISVLSPRYVKSEWCMKELRAFHESYRRGVQEDDLGPRSRIFKVIKTPLPSYEDYPEEVQGLTGYSFYEQQGEKLREYNPAYGTEYGKKFINAAEDLAQEIYKTLIQARRTSSAPPSAARELASVSESEIVPPERQQIAVATIYLAETSRDMKEFRDNIRRELVQAGHRVLPQDTLFDEPVYLDAVRAALAECSFSIHLVGSVYGPIPEGERLSIIPLQYDLTRELSELPACCEPLVWIPPGLECRDDRQREYVNSLLNDPHTRQLPLEQFKTLVHRMLAHSTSADLQPQVMAGPPSGPLIYLMHDARDLQAVSDPIADVITFLQDRGFELRYPLFDEPDENQTREYHEDNLRSCAGCLIYYGRGNARWLNAKIAEVRKAPALRTHALNMVKGVFLAEPGTPQKALLRLPDPEMILMKGFGTFTPQMLSPFLALFPSADGGAP